MLVSHHTEECNTGMKGEILNSTGKNILPST